MSAYDFTVTPQKTLLCFLGQKGQQESFTQSRTKYKHVWTKISNICETAGVGLYHSAVAILHGRSWVHPGSPRDRGNPPLRWNSTGCWSGGKTDKQNNKVRRERKISKKKKAYQGCEGMNKWHTESTAPLLFWVTLSSRITHVVSCSECSCGLFRYYLSDQWRET